MLLLLACTGGDSAADSAASLDPTLTNVQAEVFGPSCAFSTCHASPGASDLVLDDGASWAELVTVESVDNPGQILVIPGDSEGSYLMAKVRGDAGIVGDRMPSTGSMLPEDKLQLLATWIDAGAADD